MTLFPSALLFSICQLLCAEMPLAQPSLTAKSKLEKINRVWLAFCKHSSLTYVADDETAANDYYGVQLYLFIPGFNSSLAALVTEILEHHFPPCEIILLQDTFFANNMNGWLQHFPYPYYSLTLDGKPFPDYTTWKGVTETAGFTCSTIIATCLSFSTCRNNDSATLFAMLDANGILLKERRTLLYIDQEIANGTWNIFM